MKTIFLAAAASMLLAGSAQAVTLFSDTTATGAIASPDYREYSFLAGAGAGTASFQIQAYNTLDGANCCTDTFSFLLNGATLFSATYSLGGGGSDVVYTAPPAGSIVTVVNGGGGTITAAIPIALLAGSNTIRLAYSGASQGLGDEGWGVNSITVDGNAATAAVPEPASWAMMIGGFGLIGGMARRRRTAVRFG